MKVLILNTDPAGFLEWMYARDPALRGRPYPEQMRARMASLFGVADFYSRALARLGQEAVEIHANNPWMQAAWAREHSLPIAPLWTWRWRLRRRLVPWVSRTLRTEGMSAILQAQITGFDPDVILNQDMVAIPARLLRKDRKDLLLVGQHPFVTLPPADELREYDLVISSMPSAVEDCLRLGIPSCLNRMGFDPEALKGIGAQAESHPVTFVGGLSRMHRLRIAFLERLARLVPELRVWAPDIKTLSFDSPLRRCYRGPAWGRDTLGILRSSRITLNRHEDLASHANNMRLYEATAAGTLLLTDELPGLSGLFKLDEEVVAYRDPEDAARRIRHYLDHEDERAAIARAGQARTLREHTYLNRMGELLEVLHDRLAGARS